MGYGFYHLFWYRPMIDGRYSTLAILDAPQTPPLIPPPRPSSDASESLLPPLKNTP